MQQTAEQIDNFEGYEAFMLAQQGDFKEYLSDSYNSDISIHKRYEFLQTVDYELCSLRLMYANKIKENDVVHFRFWNSLILDTRKYVQIGIKTLDFQRKCPEHMVVAQPALRYPLIQQTRNFRRHYITPHPYPHPFSVFS